MQSIDDRQLSNIVQELLTVLDESENVMNQNLIDYAEERERHRIKKLGFVASSKAILNNSSKKILQTSLKSTPTSSPLNPNNAKSTQISSPLNPNSTLINSSKKLITAKINSPVIAESQNSTVMKIETLSLSKTLLTDNDINKYSRLEIGVNKFAMIPMKEFEKTKLEACVAVHMLFRKHRTEMIKDGIISNVINACTNFLSTPVPVYFPPGSAEEQLQLKISIIPWQVKMHILTMLPMMTSNTLTKEILVSLLSVIALPQAADSEEAELQNLIIVTLKKAAVAALNLYGVTSEEKLGEKMLEWDLAISGTETKTPVVKKTLTKNASSKTMAGLRSQRKSKTIFMNGRILPNYQ